MGKEKLDKMMEEISDRSAKKAVREAMEEASRHKDILLEDLRSDFRIFGEALSGVRDELKEVKKKGEATFEEVGLIKIELNLVKEDVAVLKEDVGVLKEDVSSIKSEMKIMNNRLGNVEEEVKALRKELNLMREELKDKVSMSYIKEFDERLLRVEKKLELSTT